MCPSFPGVMGAAVADLLIGAGYTVSSWTRNSKPRAGVLGFVGQEGLRPFAAACDILICLLPLTSDTKCRLEQVQKFVFNTDSKFSGFVHRTETNSWLS